METESCPIVSIPATLPTSLRHAPTLRLVIGRWQTASGSLTARLGEFGPVTVQRLRQRVAPLLPGEARDLGIAPGTRCLVREVVLRVQGVAVVWARSVTPARSACGPWKALRGLGQQPLARLLFTDRDVGRSSLVAERHRRGSVWHMHADKAWRAAQGQSWPHVVLLGRSSVFHRRGAPLRVFEGFTLQGMAIANPRRMARAAGHSLVRGTGIEPVRPLPESGGF